MLVKTPALKLAVEVRDVGVAGERIAFTGVANNMPCTVEMTPKEMLAISRAALKPAVLRMLARAMLPTRRA